MGLNGQLIIRLYTDFLSEGLIIAYQHAHQRIYKNQQWHRKAVLQSVDTVEKKRKEILYFYGPVILVMILKKMVDPSLVIITIYLVCLISACENKGRF